MADHTNVPTRTAQSSDIVTRLREHPVELLHCDCVRCEAANKIEQLCDALRSTPCLCLPTRTCRRCKEISQPGRTDINAIAQQWASHPGNIHHDNCWRYHASCAIAAIIRHFEEQE